MEVSNWSHVNLSLEIAQYIMERGRNGESKEGEESDLCIVFVIHLDMCSGSRHLGILLMKVAIKSVQ